MRILWRRRPRSSRGVTPHRGVRESRKQGEGGQVTDIKDCEVCVMQSAETVLDVLRDRGRRGLPCDELYRQLFNPHLYLLAYGRIYSNHGAMTPGASGETADGMSLGKIGRIIDALRHERYRFSPVKRIYIVRREAPRRIPCSAGRDLEGGLWVYRLTRCRKADGTRACRMAVAR